MSEEPTTDKKAPSISFKLQAPSRTAQTHIQQSANRSLLDRDSLTDNASDKKDYLLSVEGNKLQTVIPTPAAKEFIIPLIKKNNWRLPSTNKKEEKRNEGTDNLEDKEAADAILKDLQRGNLTAGGGSAEEGEDGNSGPVIPLLMQNKPPVESSDDKLNDVELRPPQSSIDDYEDMPINQFGAAMLKGMGWKPGEAIGLNKKGLLEPIEYIPHPGGLGLGATPKPPDPKKGKNKIKKPGEIEKKKVLPYKDKDGRVKHIKKIGEEIPEQIPEGFYPGNYGRVIAGRHTGLYGKIISVDEDNARVVLKMIINKENYTFSQHYVDLVSRNEATSGKMTPEVSLKSSTKQYGLILPNSKQSSDAGGHSKLLSSGGDSNSSRSSEQDTKLDNRNSPQSIGNRSGNRSGRSSGGRTDDHKRSSRESDGSRNRDRFAEEERRWRDKKKASDDTSRQLYEGEEEKETEHSYRAAAVVRKHPHSSSIADAKKLDTIREEKEEFDYGRKKKIPRVETSGSTSQDRSQLQPTDSRDIGLPKQKRQRMDDFWLMSQLRVRMIDRKYKRGKYYNQKVVVLDVVDPTTCICQTDDGKLLEGIHSDMLETMIPKVMDSVIMIVRGEFKGQLAHIVERNNSKCIATVQLLQSKEVLTIDYDFVCEYVGETL